MSISMSAREALNRKLGLKGKRDLVQGQSHSTDHVNNMNPKYSSVHINESKVIWGKHFVDILSESFELQTNSIPNFASSSQELSDHR